MFGFFRRIGHTEGEILGNIMDKQANVDLSALLLGFSSAALYYLGEAPLEGKAPPQRNLPLARQNIDILLLLQEKTKGNLSPDEEKLLGQLLSDLQIKFVDAAKAPKT
jgi:hypothetical protein